jgi:hypothetical protein
VLQVLSSVLQVLCPVLRAMEYSILSVILHVDYLIFVMIKNKAQRTKHKAQSTKNKAQSTKNKEQSTKNKEQITH